MDYMYIALAGSVLLIVVLMLIVRRAIIKSKRTNAKNKEELSLKGIEAGICERLHKLYPDSRWRWVCRPVEFALNGGIARIDVIESCGGQKLIDVCFNAGSYTMTLYMLNAVELAAPDSDKDKKSTAAIPTDSVSSTAASSAPDTDTKPCNKEGLNAWYNIELIDSLTELIGNLNAEDEVCLFIDQKGKVYVDESDDAAVIHDFGQLPDMALWSHIIDRLSYDGLFAEVRELRNENCIFMSWGA